MRVVWRVDGGDGGRVGRDRDGGRVGFFAGGRRGARGAAPLLDRSVGRIIEGVERSVPWLSHAMGGGVWWFGSGLEGLEVDGVTRVSVWW